MSSSYTAYKKDTAILLQWLSDTAKSCGFVSQPPTQNEPPKPSQRLKGKERKKAKEVLGSKNPIQGAAHCEKRKISIKEFLSQAKAVTKSRNPRVVVPESIIKAGLRAVNARRRCGEWFEQHSAHSETSNQEHQFFVKLLEEVITILSVNFEPSISTVTGLGDSVKDNSRSSTANLTEKSKQTLENLFSVLDLEEPKIALETSSEILPEKRAKADGKVSQTAVPPVNFEIEDEKEFAEENARFAAYCLYNDLWNFREYLGAIWSTYVVSETDLATVSVLTNTAFDLARRAEEDFRTVFPDLKSADEVIRLILDPASPKALEKDTIPLQEWVYQKPYHILSSFRGTLASGLVAATQKGHLQDYDSSAHWFDISEAARDYEDRTLLQNLLPEFWLLKLWNAPLPAQDELTRGLRDFADTKEIPVWLTFAIQVFLDVHHMTRNDMVEDTPRALHNLRELAMDVRESLVDYEDYTESHSYLPAWESANPNLVSDFRSDIEMFALGDFFLYMKREYGGWLDVSSPMEEFHLLKRHPMFCGTLSFYIILNLHHVGVALAEGWGIMSVAHFYNTMRQQKEVPIKVWRDMELMIAFQTEEHVFLGEAPKMMKDCFKKMCLMTGLSATAFVKTRRKATPSVSKRGPRGLRDASPLVEFLNGSYLGGTSLDYATRNIEELLNLQSEKPQTSSSKHNRQLASSNRLSPEDFLETLHDALNSELPALLFNYIQLTLSARILINDLTHRLDHELQALLYDGYIEKSGSDLCFDIVSIVADLCTPFVTYARWTEGQRTVIEETSKVLNELIDEIGNQVCAQSIGFLVDADTKKATDAAHLHFETHSTIWAGIARQVQEDENEDRDEDEDEDEDQGRGDD